MALVMIVSVMTLTGCKKSKLTDAELFELGLNQLVTPKIAEVFAGADTFKDSNRFALSLDNMEISSSLAGEEMKFPKIAFEALMKDEESGKVTFDMAMDEEKIGGILQLVDGDKLYVSFPEATELYLVCTFEELLELSGFMPAEGEEAEGISIISSFFSGFFVRNETETQADISLDEYLESEKVTEKVFGEEVDGLKKITVSFDGEDWNKIFEEAFKLLPEETVDLIEIPEIDEEMNIEFSMSVYMDGEELKKFECDMDMNVDGKPVTTKIELDVENTADTYKLDGDVKVNVNGGEVMKIDVKTDVTLEDGELEGEMKLKPKFNIAVLGEEEAVSEMEALLEGCAITVELEGELTEEAFDIEVTTGVTVSMMTLKIPFEIKGEKEDDKCTFEFGFDMSVMGMMDIVLNATLEVEKVDDVKLDEYDEENAFGIDDEDKGEQFVTEISEYFDSLEGMKSFFESLEKSSSSGEDEYIEPLFNVYKDELDMYFYADGTGIMSNYYDAVIGDESITILEDGEEALTITMTSDSTADIAGIEYNYIVEDYGDGVSVITFTSDISATEICVYSYDSTASVDEYFAYSMDDTTLTIDGTAFPYYVDEENGIFNLNGVDYYYISNDVE